jgi:hypothetical protein
MHQAAHANPAALSKQPNKPAINCNGPRDINIVARRERRKGILAFKSLGQPGVEANDGKSHEG